MKHSMLVLERMHMRAKNTEARVSRLSYRRQKVAEAPYKQELSVSQREKLGEQRLVGYAHTVRRLKAGQEAA